jgi:hypothetical protein
VPWSSLHFHPHRENIPLLVEAAGCQSRILQESHQKAIARGLWTVIECRRQHRRILQERANDDLWTEQEHRPLIMIGLVDEEHFLTLYLCSQQGRGGAKELEARFEAFLMKAGIP